MEQYTITVPKNASQDEKDDFEMAIRWREYADFFTQISNLYYEKNQGKIDLVSFANDVEHLIIESNLPTAY